jgi:hypothetical protein
MLLGYSQQIISDLWQFSCQGTLPLFYIKCTIHSPLTNFSSVGTFAMYYLMMASWKAETYSKIVFLTQINTQHDKSVSELFGRCPKLIFIMIDGSILKHTKLVLLLVTWFSSTARKKEAVGLGVKRIPVPVAQHNILCPVCYSDAVFISV